MKITASQLRANIDRVLDQVAQTGEPLEIEREGQLLRIVAVAAPRKLDRLVRREAVIGDPSGW